ncbi:MAG: hypothetical protein ABRQ27_05840 [Clostridiaceae bacterium]
MIMGAGNPAYDDNGNISTEVKDSYYNYVGGNDIGDKLLNGTLRETAYADGGRKSGPWTLIQSKEEFINLAEGGTPHRVIGVPQVYTTLQQARGGDNKADAFKVPIHNNVPGLAEISLIKTIDSLPIFLGWQTAVCYS